MDHISLFLKKFENLGVKEFLVKEEMARVVGEVCGVKISPKNVSYKNGTLTVQGSRMLKSEIFLRKSEIVALLEKNLTKTKINRIV